MPTGVLIYSICKTNPGQHLFYIMLGSDLKESTTENLIKTARTFHSDVSFLKIPKSLEQNLPMGKKGQPEYISIATYYRLFLQTLLPESVSKIIYLDGDIICRSSLDDLWNTDIENAPAAAVYEIENNDHRYERLCYSSSEGYFNAGVLLINVDYWRKMDAQSEFMDFMVTHSDRIVYHDQDVLNSVFHGRILSLPVKYNMLNSYFVDADVSYRYPLAEVVEARKKPVIVHYSSHLKPWFKGCSHPYAVEFVQLLRQTAWRNYKLKPYPSNSFSGKISNFLVCLGLRRYNGHYYNHSIVK